MEKGERWDKTSCKESETTENNKNCRFVKHMLHRP